MMVEKTLRSSDGLRRVDIVRRENGTFGFEPFRWDEIDQAWLPDGRYSKCVAVSLIAAEAEARDRVSWLNDLDSDV
jgi:hypothetical protein